MGFVVGFCIALLLVFAASRLLGFSAQKPQDYAQSTPAFSLQEQLSGEILSEGMIYGPTGRVNSRFNAKMVGNWEGRTGTLTEEFTYSSGKTQSRKWQLQLIDNNNFTAEADDIIGKGRGIVSGATVRMEYTIMLPKDAGGHKLDVTDWLYLTENGVILNKSEMRKFGIKVAELIATMRPA